MDDKTKIMPAPDYLTCQDCGAKNDTVVATVCPYAQDVDGIEVPITACEKCLGDRAADI